MDEKTKLQPSTSETNLEDRAMALVRAYAKKESTATNIQMGGLLFLTLGIYSGGEMVSRSLASYPTDILQKATELAGYGLVSLAACGMSWLSTTLAYRIREKAVYYFSQATGELIEPYKKQDPTSRAENP